MIFLTELIYITKNKKGISPLIAAVLLIAFTMGIAAILTTWITSFTTTQKEKTQVFEEKIECAYMNLRADSDYARLNTTNYIFQDYIVNTGSVDVEITKFVVWVDDVPIIPVVMTNITHIAKGTGETININLSNVLKDGGELTQVKFETRCDAAYTTLWKPVSGWSRLTHTISASDISGTA
ncbi:hypothetical protein GQ473_01495 [archaeon]|nr:hypothetical protein [archaeon]